MAMVKCPECGNWISDQAESCPHCGYSANKNKHKKIINELKDKIIKFKDNKKILIGCGCCVAVVILICCMPTISKEWEKAQHETQVKNDKEAPKVTYTGDGITIIQGDSISESEVKSDLKATDNVTSADKLIYNIPISDIDTDAEEDTTLKCTVKDEAGNIGTVDVPITITSRYTKYEKLKYLALSIAIMERENRLKDPSSLNIRGMGWDTSGCAYLYYSASNSFGGTVSGYCQYDTTDQSFYAPGATSEGWEVRYLQRKYESSEKVSMAELQEFQRYN